MEITDHDVKTLSTSSSLSSFLPKKALALQFFDYVEQTKTPITCKQMLAKVGHDIFFALASLQFYCIILGFLCRHQSEKRIRQLPEIDGLSKDTVVTSWMAKYDALMKGSYYLIAVMIRLSSPLFSEEDGRRPGQRPATNMLGNEVMTKEQLYDLYQQRESRTKQETAELS